MNTAVPAPNVNMLGDRNLFAKKNHSAHTSPRISSPLTPPATGETKINNGESSTSSLEGGIAKRKPKDLSQSPTARILNTFPIRDSPGNPFLQGGPADAGLSGPRMWQARQRLSKIPKRERGKMTYVFRGQRVTYAEPFASDSEEEEEGSITSTYLGDGYWRHERNNDRLQPRILFPQAMSTSSSSSEMSRKRPAHLDYLSDPSAYNPSRSSDSYSGINHQKRRKVNGIQEQNQDLLDHLDRAGWNSDGEMDVEEEDEVSESMLAREEQEEENSIDPCYTDKTIRPRQFDSDDESEEEENEVEENPFLDAAPMQKSNLRTYEEERASIFGLQHNSEQIHNIYTNNHPRAAFSSNPYANRPRGHAHSLAHSMHVPGHLRGRRY